MFQFPILCKGCFVWCYSCISQSELGLQSCAVLGKKRKILYYFCPFIYPFIEGFPSAVYYGTWEAAGECSGAGIVEFCFVCPHT